MNREPIAVSILKIALVLFFIYGLLEAEKRLPPGVSLAAALFSCTLCDDAN